MNKYKKSIILGLTVIFIAFPLGAMANNDNFIGGSLVDLEDVGIIKEPYDSNLLETNSSNPEDQDLEDMMSAEKITSGNSLPMLDLPVDTEFNIIKTKNNNLLFLDLKRNAILKVSYEDSQLKIEKINTNVDIKNITSIELDGNYLITAQKDKATITKESLIDGSAIQYKIKDNAQFKDMGDVTSITVINDNVYVSIDTYIFKLNSEFTTFANFNTKETIDDVFKYNDELYVINSFGIESNNSVLFKMDLENFYAIDMMELKGIFSKSIGISSESVYIRQNEHIKEVNLNRFSAEKGYTREAGIPVLVKNGVFYSLSEGRIQSFKVEDRVNPLMDVVANGYNLYLK